MPCDDLGVTGFSSGCTSGGEVTGRAFDGCSTTGDGSSGGTSSSREWTEDTEDNDSNSVSTDGTGKMQRSQTSLKSNCAAGVFVETSTYAIVRTRFEGE